MTHPIFIQIFTGEYTYTNFHGEKVKSHCLYALGENGEVYKYIPKERKWIIMEDLDLNYGME